VGEVGILEQVAHEALGEQVLNEHLVNHVLRQLRVEGLTAERDESGEGMFEAGVLLVRFRDVLMERLGEIGNAALELVHGAVEFALVGFVVREEAVEEIGNFDWFAKGELAGFAAILVEHGSAGIFEDGVAVGISGFQLLANLGGEIIRSILGLPPAAGEAKLVTHGAVGNDTTAA